jgi:hypothetical protein
MIHNNGIWRPTGCLPRRSKMGAVCSVAAEKLDVVIPRQEWDALLKDLPGGCVDMTDRIGVHYDQNGFGSCAWEGTTKALEIASRFAGQDTDELNAWFGYGITVNFRGGPYVGTSIDQNLVKIREIGAPSVAVWPRSHGPNKKPSPEAYADALQHRIDEALDCANINEVGTCLLKHHPVVIGWNGHCEVLAGLKPGGIVTVCGSYGAKYYGGKGIHEERIDKINFKYGAFAVRTVSLLKV